MKKLIVLLIATFSLTVTAQEKVTEGVITSKMTMSSNNEQMNAQFEMMGDTQITTYFKEGKLRSETKNPMSGETVSISDKEANKVLTLQNIPMYGKKYSFSEFEDESESFEDVVVTKGDETKTILGYQCQQYNVVTTQEGVEMTLEIYTTEKIEAINNQTSKFGHSFGGYPMLMKMNVEQQGINMQITYEVTDVKKEDISDDMFNLTPPEGYEKLEE